MKKTKKIIKILLIALLLYVLLRFILLPNINSPQFREFVSNLGVFGYLVIIGYIVMSHVFAPLAGTPGVALGITIYGIHTGMWLLYFGSLISCVINFYIARKFGRQWVEKLAGKSSMQKIDEFTKVGGRKVFLVSRLLGFSLFDFISYAAGLTTLKFRDYFAITAVTSLIVNLLGQYLLKDIDFQSEQGIMIWIGSIVIAGVTFGLLISRYLSRAKSEENSKGQE